MNKYPETKMTGEELHQAYVSTPVLGRSVDFAMIAVGNAALRHAIDSGQVVTLDEHNAGCAKFGKELAKSLQAKLDAAEQCNAARDMAIAEAVRNAAREKFQGNAGERIGITTAYGQISSLDLAAIISKVPA
jgi:hypothetical protein